jgi:hypothetical protein
LLKNQIRKDWNVLHVKFNNLIKSKTNNAPSPLGKHAPYIWSTGGQHPNLLGNNLFQKRHIIYSTTLSNEKHVVAYSHSTPISLLSTLTNNVRNNRESIVRP